MFLKIMSFDIECLPYKGQMPRVEQCPILLISCVFNCDMMIDNVMTRKISLLLTKRTEKVVIKDGEGIYVYVNEKNMLEKFFELVRKSDIITGYNINGFDFPYVIDRYKILTGGYVNEKGRIIGGESVKVGNGDGVLYYRKHFSKGFSVIKIGGLTGMVLIDVLYVLRREDAANPFKKKYNLKKLTLEHVSKEILGIEKLEFGSEKMERWWEFGDWELGMEMVKYSMNDAWLALEFVRKFRLLDKFVTLSKESGKLIQAVIDSMGSGLMVEYILLKKFKEEDRVMPCRGKELEVSVEELEGAYVYEPKYGVVDNIGSTDYKSLYPSVMITHNLCCSTLVNRTDVEKMAGKINEESFEDGSVYGWFVKKEIYEGIIPRLLKGYLNERAKLKKEMKKCVKDSSEYMMLDATQEAVKILLNSFYGYSGDSSAKTYNWIVASAVTTNGRKQIKKTINMIDNSIVKNFKLSVVLADTDSCYINVSGNEVSREDVVYCLNFVVNKVNEMVEKPMELVFEDYIKRSLIVAKKRYAMLIVGEDGKKIIVNKGLEVIRRDWSDFATQNMNRVIEYVLSEDKVSDGIKKSVEMIKSEAKRLKDGKVGIGELIITNKLTMPIESYKNKEAHVIVAMKMLERGKSVEIGDRVQYIVIDNGKTLISEKAEDVEYVVKNNLKIDYNYYIYKQLIPPTMRVLGLLGVKRESIVLDEKQRNLSEWL